MTLTPSWLEPSAPGDRYTDFCLWDYPPAAPTAGKLRSVNLLYASFAAAGVVEPLRALCRAVQRALGPGNTVWGVKLADGRLCWELYVYDYARQQRQRGVAEILGALGPAAATKLADPRHLPYFMCSVDLDADLVRGRRGIDALSLYIGTPGSSVSAGLCYELTAAGLSFRNLYYFFSTRRQRSEIEQKVLESVHLDPTLLRMEQVLLPELMGCETTVVANKRDNDAVYFTRLGIDVLVVFLRRFGFPPALTAFAEHHRARLDHLRFDLAFDYRMTGGRLQVPKVSFFGYL
ncbi:hypothetical protein [uncultured Thiohalocapsa sp.]|uniref:hypothetical protein n=1 Tax=uncultured Thiohalocapsa sp. TaxID=768990 RepID=UPI0025DAEE5F|nr:hypothetical protein [uncultured Thiohalocapsa sp.]